MALSLCCSRWRRCWLDLAVSLGNVLSAGYAVPADKAVGFITGADQVLYKALKAEAFEVQVGIHELLGHGSGKLFHAGTDAAAALLNTPCPLEGAAGKLINGPFYAAGATWDSTFGKIASSYEECRAECTGLYLCNVPEVLAVFGHHGSGSDGGGGAAAGMQMHDVAYINWLLMCRAGLVGLEFYTPSTGSWRQAHMQARYVIVRVLLEAGHGLLTLRQCTNTEDGQPDVEVVLNRALIPTVGRDAIGSFLKVRACGKCTFSCRAHTEHPRAV